MGLGIDIIIFVSAILFGIFLYWRESNGNGAYRFINKIMNSKELQMDAKNPKGFIYKQPFIPRLLFVVISLLIIGLVLQFLTPIEIFSNYFALSGFATFATGTLIGTYLANFVIKTTEVVEEKSDSLGDLVGDAVEKGKGLIEDLKNKDNKAIEEAKNEIAEKQEPEVEKKSARERLKDKGLM
ncbi:hypothetical protein [Winogradskyella aquimaris]|uniref:Uncharacterized protein n=1 Tax=Winogradskyella aquimaris TaxID=864074 RepID=A0ABU5EP60_9FLAO|nr:hypothetical protein [Winogradskyella aquimaris]MDY2588249.1 hypothetical protein [Winogradskyella aquimaris]